MYCRGTCARLGLSGTLRQAVRTLTECLAICHIAALHSAREPFHPLLRAAVGERIGNDVALCTSLDHIIADGACSSDRFFRIARVETALLGRVVRPNTCVAIRLQLKGNGSSLYRIRGL